MMFRGYVWNQRLTENEHTLNCLAKIKDYKSRGSLFGRTCNKCKLNYNTFKTACLMFSLYLYVTINKK